LHTVHGVGLALGSVRGSSAHAATWVSSVPRTQQAFRSEQKLLQHYHNHGREFGLESLETQHGVRKYLDGAIRFLERDFGDRSDHRCLKLAMTGECDYVRYNRRTREYAVLAHDGYIRTYMTQSSTYFKDNCDPEACGNDFSDYE
jgi:hypothetical protein